MKRFLTAALAFVTGLICLAGPSLTDIQKQFIQQRSKVVARDTASLPGYVINTFQRGTERWTVTNRLAVIGAPVSRRISKFRLIVALKSIDKWDTAKEFINRSGYYDEWLACQFIDDHFPLFIQATNSVVEAGIATDAEIKKVVEKSYDD